MKYNDFQKRIHKPYFTQQDLRLLHLPVYNYQLSLWQDKGYIKHLKRGTYYFCNQSEQICSEEVSFVLYEPSYISTESALSYYGFIPEVVPAITAVSTRTTRQFHNAFGHFMYQHVRPKLFFGYTNVTTTHGKYLFACPEKAVLDFLYLRLGKMSTSNDITELRLNYNELHNVIIKKTLVQYAQVFNIKKLTRIVQLILQQC